MKFEVHIYHHFLSEGRSLGGILRRMEERIVGALTDKIAEVSDSLDAAIVRVQEDVTALNDKIAELQALVDQGLATPEDMAKLDELKAKLDAIDPTKPEVLPEPNP